MNRSSDTPFSRSADRDNDGAPGAESASAGIPDPSVVFAGGTVFCADPAQAAGTAADAVPEGFAGRLSLRGAERLGYEQTVSALQRLGMLVSWAQAQQARVAARLEELFARDIADTAGREEPALAMSLAAAEASTLLNIPHMSAMQLISESSRLCTDTPQTLARLAEGKIAIQHARIILDETHNLPADTPEPPARDPSGKGSEGGSGEGGSEGDAGEGGSEGATGEGNSNPDPGPQGAEQLDLDLGDSSGPPASDAAGGTAGDAAGDAAGDGVSGADTVPVLSVRGAFERDLLAAAEGRTAAGFGRRARRLRESRFPDLIPVRHRQAKDKRRVSFQPLPDGMSCVSAFLAAEKGQAMFTALTGAAKAGKRAGDPRTMDQLRADILTDLLLTTDTEPRPDTPANTAHHQSPVPAPATKTPKPAPVTEIPEPAPGTVTAGTETTGTPPTTGPGTETAGTMTAGSETTGTETTGTVPPGAMTAGTPPATGSGTSATGSGRPGKRPRRAERYRTTRSRITTEVMILISADTLAGLNNDPAELNGYGPISPDTARSMVLEALHWTPLTQDPETGEILTVGRRRRIPAGLKRWLQARDGTCRFPGCSVNVTHAEIDHTTPYSHGGTTNHTNLEHLCPKHHRLKTLGHWKARQPQPGTITWNSPTGRTYTTDPNLDYRPNGSVSKREDRIRDAQSFGDDPPPF